MLPRSFGEVPNIMGSISVEHPTGVNDDDDDVDDDVGYQRNHCLERQ